MNLPNKLTVVRILIVPVFFFFLVSDFITAEPWKTLAAVVALLLFVAASLTDALDGYIARSQNLVTTFGKFMDPIADKILVTAALIGFTATGALNPWATLIILSREFIVTAFRIVAMGEGVVIAANFWGKLKTITQMIALIMLLVANCGVNNPVYNSSTQVMIWISVGITILSGWAYIFKNRKLISFK